MLSFIKLSSNNVLVEIPTYKQIKHYYMVGQLERPFCNNKNILLYGLLSFISTFDNPIVRNTKLMLNSREKLKRKIKIRL